MTREFEGKSVIITGAASGIGKAAAHRFADEGASVCIADMDIARAETVSAEINARGGVTFATKVDVADQADNLIRRPGHARAQNSTEAPASAGPTALRIWPNSSRPNPTSERRVGLAWGRA